VDGQNPWQEAKKEFGVGRDGGGQEGESVRGWRGQGSGGKAAWDWMDEARSSKRPEVRMPGRWWRGREGAASLLVRAEEKERAALAPTTRPPHRRIKENEYYHE